jgi:hypothetical protein
LNTPLEVVWEKSETIITAPMAERVVDRRYQQDEN